jgi:polyisoprenoid-binding protein YceI
MMKSVLTSAVVLLALAVGSQPFAFAADNYALDTAHTSVIFGISHMGFSYTYGRFNKVDGKYMLDEANPAASNFELTIDAGSIDTNDPKRDGHLKSADFLNAGEFPLITFKSTEVKVKQADASAAATDTTQTVYEVTGDLTMHGVTRPVTLPLILLKVGPGMDGKKRSGFLCEARLLRSEFGMTNMIPAVGDDVAVTISFEGGVQ